MPDGQDDRGKTEEDSGEGKKRVRSSALRDNDRGLTKFGGLANESSAGVYGSDGLPGSGDGEGVVDLRSLYELLLQ